MPARFSLVFLFSSTIVAKLVHTQPAHSMSVFPLSKWNSAAVCKTKALIAPNRLYLGGGESISHFEASGTPGVGPWSGSAKALPTMTSLEGGQIAAQQRVRSRQMSVMLCISTAKCCFRSPAPLCAAPAPVSPCNQSPRGGRLQSSLPVRPSDRAL